MSSSTKGLARLGRAYREHVEGCTCDYVRERGWSFDDLTCPARMWEWVVWRNSAVLSHGVARTLRAARAAAHAVVMERETRGLTPKDPMVLE